MVAHGRLAVTSYADAWFKAERLGRGVLTDPEPEAVNSTIASVQRAEMRAFERGGAIPPVRS